MDALSPRRWSVKPRSCFMKRPAFPALGILYETVASGDSDAGVLADGFSDRSRGRRGYRFRERFSRVYYWPNTRRSTCCGQKSA